MARRGWISLILMGLTMAGWAGRRCAAEDPPPNIVFFLIDDLGWTDLSVAGSRYYETPNIDRLASQGMRFTQAYANAPNCAPSRACLMSGQYTPRHGIYTVGDPARGNDRYRKLEPIPNQRVLAESCMTLAQVLRGHGYTTATIGKWHLGNDPTRHGFDVNIAGCQWGSPSGGGYHSPYEYPNLIQNQPGEYLTDRLTEEACQFIEANRQRPFFLYLTHYAVHTPIQAKAELVDRYKAKPASETHHHARYAAMIQSMDESVGAVLAKLEALELTDRTVICFFSDNGGFSRVTSNAPLRGAKGVLYEGGIRVPMIVQWPNVTPPGSVCDHPVIGTDFFPTLLEIAGRKPPEQHPLDGESLVPLLKRPSARLKRSAIFWHFPCYLQAARKADGPFRTTPAGAVRMGDWKLIEFFEDGRLELFHLRDDIGEKNNLAQQMPEKTKQLAEVMARWREDIRAPVPTRPNPDYDANAVWPPKNRRSKSSTR